MTFPDPMARFRDFLDSQVPMMCQDAIIAADNIEEFVRDHIEAVRKDERHRLAQLIEDHGETLTSFTGDDSNTLKLVVYMLRLDGREV